MAERIVQVDGDKRESHRHVCVRVCLFWTYGYGERETFRPFDGAAATRKRLRWMGAYIGVACIWGGGGGGRGGSEKSRLIETDRPAEVCFDLLP